MRKDRMSKEQRSYTMSKIRSSGTEFERKFFKAIRAQGIKFKENYSGVMGKPDIALPKSRKAVFLHSDFWHGWQYPRWEKILPNDFWKNKIRKHRERDRKVIRSLRRLGWSVIVVWEHSFRKDPDRSLKGIKNFLSE